MSHDLTRRHVLGALLATGVLRASGSPARFDAPSQWILIGTGHGQGIYRARWNSATGEIGIPELAAATPQPSFLALHPHLPVVYACNELDNVDGAVSAFALDRRAANLKALATQNTRGGAPCFASVDRTGRLLFAANYAGGGLAVFPLEANGLPRPAATVFKCSESTICGTGGPVRDRQSGPHLHCAMLSPDNRFVLACDLGDDAILVFPIHPHALQPLSNPVRIATEPGAGPRHLAFHPNGRWLYCINEINCTVALYVWHPGSTPSAALETQSIVSIKPPHASENPPSTGAEIVLTRDGRFAYTSTRFSDVLTSFTIGSEGRLTQLQQISCGGKTPRFFTLSPDERWLLCANQDSNSITLFARDATTGQLRPRSAQKADNPECLLFV